MISRKDAKCAMIPAKGSGVLNGMTPDPFLVTSPHSGCALESSASFV
jgi:hypothetical protein